MPTLTIRVTARELTELKAKAAQEGHESLSAMIRTALSMVKARAKGFPQGWRLQRRLPGIGRCTRCQKLGLLGCPQCPKNKDAP